MINMEQCWSYNWWVGGRGAEVLLKKPVALRDLVGTAVVGYGIFKCKDMLDCR
jgi:hypothetical protein